MTVYQSVSEHRLNSQVISAAVNPCQAAEILDLLNPSGRVYVAMDKICIDPAEL